MGARTAAIVVLLAAVLLHAPTLGHGYAYDDLGIVLGDPRVSRPPDLHAIFTGPYWPPAYSDHTGPHPAIGVLYRPLATLSYALGHALWARSPAAEHAVNLALHGAVALLVFEVARHLLAATGPALLASLLWLTRPVLAEPVAVVTGRADLLAALCCLAALRAWLGLRGPGPVGVRGTGAGRWGGAGTAAWAVCPVPFFFVAAVLAKESAAVFPLALLGVEGLARCRGEPPTGRAGRRAILLLFAVLAAFLVWRHALFGQMRPVPYPTMDNPVMATTGAGRLLSALWILGTAAVRVVYPPDVAIDLSYPAFLPPPAPWAWQVLLGVGLLLLLAGILLRSVRRGDGATGDALVLAGATYAVTANLFIAIGTVYADRLLYLPTAFLLVAAVAALRERYAALPRLLRRGVLVLLLIALVGSAARAVTVAATYRDNATLFRALAASSPGSARVHFNLSEVREEDGDPAGALGEILEALRLSPDYPAASGERARLVRRLSDPGLPAEMLARACALEPIPVIRLALARALVREGRPAEALGHLEAVIAGRPRGEAELRLEADRLRAALGDHDGR